MAAGLLLGRRPTHLAADGYQYTDNGRERQGCQSPLGSIAYSEVQRLIRFMPKIRWPWFPDKCRRRPPLRTSRLRFDPISKRTCRLQTNGLDVASFDSGYGSAYLARMVRKTGARDFFLGRNYSADEASMGMVNESVPTRTWKGRARNGRRK